MSLTPQQYQQLRIQNLQLKQQLAQQTAIANHNASYIQSTGGGVVKRPHYYAINTQPILTEQQKRIAQLNTIVSKQNNLIRNYQSYTLGIQRHFANILKIDQDIYKKLQPVSPNVRMLEEAKMAVKRGESRQFIGNILDRMAM